MTGIEVAVIAGMVISAADVALVAGAAIGAYMSIQSGNQESDWNKYNAQVATNNAVSARQQAAFEADLHSDDVRRMQALQRVQAAEQGGGAMGGGLDIIGQSARNAEMDRQAILYSGEIGAVQFESQAILDRSKGKAAKAAGPLNAASAILGGASNLNIKSAPKAPKKSSGFAGKMGSPRAAGAI